VVSGEAACSTGSTAASEAPKPKAKAKAKSKQG